MAMDGKTLAVNVPSPRGRSQAPSPVMTDIIILCVATVATDAVNKINYRYR